MMRRSLLSLSLPRLVCPLPETVAVTYLKVMKNSFAKWLVVSAALGLLAPGFWFLAQGIFSGDPRMQWKILYPLEHVIRVIWPASVWVMATDGIERTPTAYLFIFMSVAANIILYALVGIAIWRLKHLFARDKSFA
jgi:hypothetical protein